MIFPDIRLSDLRRDRDEKKRAYEGSRRRFMSSLRERSRPLTFIREHPQLIITTLITLFSTPRITGKAMSLLGINGKKGFLGKMLQFGWMWKAFKMGRSLIKTFRSAAA